MLITIKLHYPNCRTTKVVKKRKKSHGKQNYLCKDCHHQFIDDHSLAWKGGTNDLPKKMMFLVRGNSGVRYIAEIV